MSAIEAPICRDDDQRRADILAHPTANGIDFVEVDAADHRQLTVFFLKPLPPADALDLTDPDDAYGLTADLSRLTIAGGARVVGIRIVAATRQSNGSLRLTTSAPGDFSAYTLTLDVPALDPVANSTALNFMATCPVDFDCRQPAYCPPPDVEEPQLDYQAKDYASFRRLLLELGSRLNPNFKERNPADLGVALVELLAYEGDQLSYFQDAVGNEASLETSRQRLSVKRHARLVDYRMHEGRNAWTWAHLAVNAPHNLVQGTALTSRISAPLAGETQPPGVAIAPARITAETLETDGALVGTVVFETTHPQRLEPTHNVLRIHAWGNEECCLAAGSRVAYLYSLPAGSSTAVRPQLAKGDFLLFEEVKGPETGLAADADPLRRQVVRIDETPMPTADPVYQDTLVGDALQRSTGVEPPLPLLKVRWRREDAITQPFCLSTRLPDGVRHRNITLARGNCVLVDHGQTHEEVHVLAAPVPADQPFRLELDRRPLTFEQRAPGARFGVGTPRTELGGPPSLAQPAIELELEFPTGMEFGLAVPDLLDSPPLELHFVVETDHRGGARLRFGDGVYGREPAGATKITATYRLGNGPLGNIGREALSHLVIAGGAPWLEAVRNPLAATGGTEPESLEEVKRRAPQAFRAEQFRAVTEADYVAAAKKLPEVAGAVATFRWTGSWYTVFVGVDPRDDEDLLRQGRGLIRLSPRLIEKVRSFLTRYRLAGYDLEIRPPTFVPLRVAIDLCVCRDHFKGDVKRAVALALSNRVLPDGTRGFFHSEFFTFGQPVYLSRLYAAVERVPGVESAVVRVFRRAGARDNGELEKGVLPIGPWEIAQLDNDPNFMENGVLELSARGGKA